MLNVQPNISSIRDVPNLQHLMSMLIEESNRIHSITTTLEDRNQERLLKTRALQQDLEALKLEINDTPSQDLIVSLLRDFLDQLQKLKRQKSHLQALDAHKLVLNDIADEIGDEAARRPPSRRPNGSFLRESNVRP